MGSLSSFFSRNWTLKLSAFGVAVLLWVAVRAEAPTRQELRDISVRVEVEDPEWALVGGPMPPTVTVRLGGPSRELIAMAVDRPTIVIPLEAVTSGDTAVSLSNSWVRVQDRPGVVVEEIQPSSVRLTLEPIERVMLPVATRIEGELPAEFAMAGLPQVFPPGIRVSGPRSLVSELDSVRLLPLDLGEVDRVGQDLGRRGHDRARGPDGAARFCRRGHLVRGSNRAGHEWNPDRTASEPRGIHGTRASTCNCLGDCPGGTLASRPCRPDPLRAGRADRA